MIVAFILGLCVISSVFSKVQSKAAQRSLQLVSNSPTLPDIFSKISSWISLVGSLAALVLEILQRLGALSWPF